MTAIPMRPPTAPLIGEILAGVERRTSTAALLTFLGANPDPAASQPGRFHVFSEAIAAQPALCDSLSSGNTAGIEREWLLCLRKHEADVRFLHALAVLLRERMHRAIANGHPSIDLVLRNTCLWMLLLASAQFWMNFSTRRIESDTPGTRRTLTSAEQMSLFENTTDTLLRDHIATAGRELAAGRADSARGHFHCVDLCRQGLDALRDTLEKNNLPCRLMGDPARAETIRHGAGKVMDDWCQALIHQAVDAFAAVEIQSKGGAEKIPALQAGLDTLMPFLALKIPVRRVLLRALEWYNAWGFAEDDMPKFRSVVDQARTVADQLVPMCTRDDMVVSPENGVLGAHFYLSGFACPDREGTIRHYEEALVWDPSQVGAMKGLATLRNS